LAYDAVPVGNKEWADLIPNMEVAAGYSEMLVTAFTSQQTSHPRRLKISPQCDLCFLNDVIIFNCTYKFTASYCKVLTLYIAQAVSID
jgi:hypothetical protein